MDEEKAIPLSWNERKLIERVLCEFEYRTMGKAIIYYGRTVESVLAKLNAADTLPLAGEDFNG